MEISTTSLVSCSLEHVVCAIFQKYYCKILRKKPYIYYSFIFLGRRNISCIKKMHFVIYFFVNTCKLTTA